MSNGYSLYYTAPADHVFFDIKKHAIDIWKTYDDTYGYATEKISRIADLPNVDDNYMYMVQMFDHSNQMRLFEKLQPESRTRVLAAML